jgi:hypothetical protein
MFQTMIAMTTGAGQTPTMAPSVQSLLVVLLVILWHSSCWTSSTKV